MGTRARYNTEQRRLVEDELRRHADAYQTVDEVLASLHAAGSAIGRTTVYRTLERMAEEGGVAKVVGTRGGSAYYKRVDADTPAQGQLLCLECGRVFPLDCSMLDHFADHVREHHGFVIDQRRTVICGTCEDCRRRMRKAPEGNGTDGHECTIAEAAER